MCSFGATADTINLGLYPADVEEVPLNSKEGVVIPPSEAELKLREALRLSTQAHARRVAAVLDIYPT